MKYFSNTGILVVIGIVFLSFGIYFNDLRGISFGFVWLLIAAAKHILITRKTKVNRPD